MLPGGDLCKLKEKNMQLNQVIDLLNLHINSRKSTILSKLKTKSSSFYSDEEDEYRPQSNRKIKDGRTQLSINRSVEDCMTQMTQDKLMIATIQDTQLESCDYNEETKEPAFQLIFIYDKQTYESCYDHLVKLLSVTRCWENEKVGYLIERQALNFLPKDVQARMSREHAEIKGYRITNDSDDLNTQIIQDLALKATLLDNESDDNSRVEQLEKPSFQIIDQSSVNGTYILRGHSYGRVNGPIAEISGEFRKITTGGQSSLKHLDIVGLVMRKSQSREMLFGFQFLCQDLPITRNN